MNKKGMFFDTVISWLVFLAYACLILLFTAVLCECGIDCKQNTLSKYGSHSSYLLDSLQVSAELEGYLRTPIPFKNADDLKKEFLLHEQQNFLYKYMSHPGIGVEVEYEPDYSNGDAVWDFLYKHPELFRTYSDKDFLTYGDFITRLSSYGNKGKSAFRLLTKLMFTEKEGSIESIEECNKVPSRITEVTGYPKAAEGESDGEYVVPLISIYHFKEDGNYKLNEIDAYHPGVPYYNEDPNFPRSEDYMPYELRDQRNLWTRTGKFVRISGHLINEKCDATGEPLVYEGFKILPGAGENRKIGVFLEVHRKHRKKI